MHNRPASGADMARSIGAMTSRIAGRLESIRPDLVMLLGDRGEMLAGAIAAIHLNLPIVHVHGGERSGTVDEPVRHAISKLAHFHFTATLQSRRRLIRMGERPENILVTGAPGLDGLAQDASMSRHELCSRKRLDPHRPLSLFVYHPVLQDYQQAAVEATRLMTTLLKCRLQVMAILPNSDAGGAAVHAGLKQWIRHPDVRMTSHVDRREFVSWMACVNVMAGNSSSGIIEAATFGTPVVNIGLRQNLRERNSNVIDTTADASSVVRAIQRALRQSHRPRRNRYGDGRAGQRIVDALATLEISNHLLNKCNTY